MMNRVEIPFSKVKTVFLLFCALFFVSFGVLFILDPEMFSRPPYHRDAMLRVVGVASVLFFSVVGFFVFRKLGDKRPGLIIDEQGIYDNTNGTSIGLISWVDITEIETKKISSTKILLVYVANPESYLDRASGFKKKLMQGNYNTYGTPLSISTNLLKYDFDALEQLLQDRLRVAKENME